MKNALKTTLIVIALLLLVVIISGCILTNLYDFDQIGEHVYYIMDRNTKNVVILGQGNTGDFFEQIGDQVYYSLNKQTGTAVIFGEGKMWDYDDFIMGGRPFYLSPLTYSEAKKVIVLDGVVNISHTIFNSCTALQEVYLPASIEEFDCDALPHCNAITGIYFQGDCPEFVYEGLGKDNGFEPFNPLEGAWPQSPVTVYYQSGTTGWDPAFWEGYASLVEQEYVVDWNPVP